MSGGAGPLVVHGRPSGSFLLRPPVRCDRTLDTFPAEPTHEVIVARRTVSPAALVATVVSGDAQQPPTPPRAPASRPLAKAEAVGMSTDRLAAW